MATLYTVGVGTRADWNRLKAERASKSDAPSSAQWLLPTPEYSLETLSPETVNASSRLVTVAVVGIFVIVVSLFTGDIREVIRSFRNGN